MEHAHDQPHSTPPRRWFLALATALAGTVAGIVTAVPLAGYFLRVRRRDVHWVALGPVDQFPLRETRTVTFDNPLRQPWDGVTAHTGVFVRRQESVAGASDQFLVLAINCAHLGCPVSWFPQSGLFLCPCHGGVYYADGQLAAGPPPRGMFHCVWRVRDGQLEIQAPHFPTLQDTLEETA